MAISDNTPDSTPAPMPNGVATEPAEEQDLPPTSPWALVLVGVVIAVIGWSIIENTSDAVTVRWGVLFIGLGLTIEMVGLVGLGARVALKRHEWLLREEARVVARRSGDPAS